MAIANGGEGPRGARDTRFHMISTNDIAIGAFSRPALSGPGRLARRRPATQWPCASTIGEILKRHGLSVPRRKKRRATPRAGPMAECRKANQVWCADFKGWFLTGDGARCTPLTITDGHTRLILRCQAMVFFSGK